MLRFCSEELLADNYFHAVLEAIRVDFRCPDDRDCSTGKSATTSVLFFVGMFQSPFLPTVTMLESDRRYRSRRPGDE
ncbi:hypothetical protein ABCW43_17550 [Neorhizobium sp. IRAMC:178]|uniref:hypothetical protein n=1 Tax=Neorhizobium tunisiense TaxID=3144793 RepID=UPI0031F604C5